MKEDAKLNLVSVILQKSIREKCNLYDKIMVSLYLTPFWEAIEFLVGKWAYSIL